MKQFLKILSFLILIFLFKSCSNNEEVLKDESLKNNKLESKQNFAQRNNSNDIEKLNNALNILSIENNIFNAIKINEKLEYSNLNPLLELEESKLYDFISIESFSINIEESYEGILHVGSLIDNKVIVAHELPNGIVDDLILLVANEVDNEFWSVNMTSLFETNSTGNGGSRMTRAQCERQTTDLVMAGTAFFGFTSWWCPPCAFAGGLATGIVAVGYLSCRLYDK